MGRELPSELLTIIFHSDIATASKAFELNTAFHKSSKEFLKNYIPPSLEERLNDDSTMLQSEVCSLLLLSADIVSSYEYESKRRFGGGEYHIFHPSTVRQILDNNDGAPGYHARAAAKRKRDTNKRKRQDQLKEHSNLKKVEITAGLSALGLELRPDSALCRQFISSGGKSHKLRYVLFMMAKMHYLHSHTNGAYTAAVEEEVRDRGEYKGYHPGIYRFCAEEVQSETRFDLPSTLPWMIEKTTKKALDDAEEAAKNAVEEAEEAAIAADSVRLAKRQKEVDLAKRRGEALSKRLAAFAKGRACKGFLKTAEELRVYVESNVDSFDFGTYFNAVLKPTVATKALLELAATFD